MFDLVAWILNFFYEIVPSYGFAIIMLTLVIMTILAPFTVRQTRSMLAMQRLAPEVKKLRTKYAGDRERMNQELMALYQANGVNPLGGCLPLLIQAPVLLVMYQVIRGMTRRVADTGLNLGYEVTRVGVPDVPKRPFNPAYLPVDSELHNALEGATSMKSFGLDLADSARSVLSASFVESIPYLLLVIAVGVTTFVQQRQITARTKKHGLNPAADDKTMQQQQAILKFMPFLLPIFSFNFPAGLVLYWFVSNLFRVGQQAFITRKVYGAEATDLVVPSATVDDVEPEPHAKPAAAAGNHGSRRPVSQKPVKRTPRKTTTPDRGSPASKRTTPSKRSAPSKRVTPSPQSDTTGSSRRRKK